MVPSSMTPRHFVSVNIDQYYRQCKRVCHFQVLMTETRGFGNCYAYGRIDFIGVPLQAAMEKESLTHGMTDRIDHMNLICTISVLSTTIDEETADVEFYSWKPLTSHVTNILSCALPHQLDTLLSEYPAF
jgi:hypothetical protein